ncbi:SMC-Scp complex subunit ScpB [Plantactinospora solaniradicis]|uniref:SMC-Scp complex subunit ScpB n=1 Tax=Plantactinospora solaniradicis TaxID=1723736 RepID=A0ABW1KPJ9_9ACTN
MTSENRPDSLAEQAAAWVPPWERAAATAPPTEPGADTPPSESTAPEPLTAEDPVVQDAARDAADQEESAGEPELVDPEPAGSGLAEERSVAELAQPSVGEDPVAPAAAEEPDTSLAEAADVPADEGGEAVGEPAALPVPDVAGPQPATLALVDDDELRGALEAILLVVDEPVAEILLAQVLEQPTERVSATLDRLARDYTAAGHGFELRRAAGGWRLYTRPEYASYVERFVLDGQTVRLTQAALETLAVVAYKQPVTRSRISAIRGVNCDGVIRTLVSRGLVQECGTEPESGAFLYRTTTLFLEKLGLDTVDQLPPLAPFLPDDVEEIADAPR